MIPKQKPPQSPDIGHVIPKFLGSPSKMMMMMNLNTTTTSSTKRLLPEENSTLIREQENTHLVMEILVFLRRQCASLRSAASRNAMMAIVDLFSNCISCKKLSSNECGIIVESLFPEIEEIIQVLVIRSGNEKKFIADL